MVCYPANANAVELSVLGQLAMILKTKRNGSMEMNFIEYQKAAYKTENTNSQSVRDRIDKLPVILIYSMFETIKRAGAKAGAVKGHLFYNRELRMPASNHPTIEKEIINERLRQLPPGLVHSVLGIADELAEIVEVLSEYVYNGKQLDWENLTEEYGDLLWFWSCGNTARGDSNQTVAEKNIKKLRLRFGDRFSEQMAKNRDLELERMVFEEEK
jgi:NTP pyrophosphatase (non-canonical NTP hydrolase)